MYKKILLGTVLLLLAVVTVACGEKDAKSIVEELSDLNKDMYSYSSSGNITFYTGEDPAKYDVEVWYKKPNLYRVSLTNKNKDITQVLLKNEQGSYVLTPQLSKSFRFQSEWPKNPAQIYLYQANIASIIRDNSYTFKKTKDGYQFNTNTGATNNPNWHKTNILLDSDLHPKKIDVFNEARQVVASMNIDTFKADASFDKDAFNVERNMSLGKFIPKSSSALASAYNTLEVIDPKYIPAGTKIMSVQKLDDLYGPTVVMKFSGKYNFTLMQGYPRSISVAAASGDIVNHDLSAIGVFLKGKDVSTLNWLYNGMEFTITGKMPIAEMSKISNSIKLPQKSN